MESVVARRMKKTLILASAAFALAVLAACAPTVATRGDLVDPDALAQIKPGVSTREDVETKLGTPTHVATFDDKVWYYIGRRTQQYSFLDPEVLKQQAIEIDFNDKGVVADVKNLNLSKAADVTPAPGATPAYGNDNTFIRELLGDLSHPMPDLSQHTPGSLPGQ
ncbi:MAG: outer membrane protein assembly factor BamE [Alphaproteobacteria bacterium]|nr:outer membrane protein assembly factor BamE [Alphaproteobacteria bacterium]